MNDGNREKKIFTCGHKPESVQCINTADMCFPALLLLSICVYHV